MTLKPCEKWDDISSLTEAYIENINIWMKFNMDKTEFIVISS